MFNSSWAKTRMLMFFVLIFSWFPFASEAREEEPSLSFKCNESARLPGLHAGENFIYDCYGRAVLLRGANVPGHNAEPFYFTEEDLAVLKSFGFNFIRLGISWEIAEPEEGKYNQDYIDSIVNFAREAGNYGIYVMPEVHQIGFGAKGSGIPEWMIEKPAKNMGDLLAVARETNRFWNSVELQEKFLRFWKYLAENFKGVPNIFGYNVMNEPAGTDCFFYGCFEKKLLPFYEKYISAIREIDPQMTIILEPCVFNLIFPARMTPFQESNLVYSTHPYFLHMYSGSGRLIVLEREPDEELKAKYQRQLFEAKEMKAPLLIGEFGLPDGQKFAEKWLKQSLALQDKYFLGSAVWVYDPAGQLWTIVDQNRNPKPIFWKLMHRPYPRFTAGVPQELFFSSSERKFLYRFQPDSKIQAPTEIYLPREMNSGSNLKVSAPNWKYDETEQLLRIWNEGAGKETTVQLKF